MFAHKGNIFHKVNFSFKSTKDLNSTGIKQRDYVSHDIVLCRRLLTALMVKLSKVKVTARGAMVQILCKGDLTV